MLTELRVLRQADPKLDNSQRLLDARFQTRQYRSRKAHYGHFVCILSSKLTHYSLNFDAIQSLAG